MENINYFDLIVLTLVALLGLKGLFRGFIKEFFALIGLVGGVFVASRLSSTTGELIDSIIPLDNNNTLMLLGFVVSLIIFWILAYILGSIISKIFSLSGLGIFDRFLGFAFGAGKIFLLLAIIIYAISQIEVINNKLIKASKNSIVYPLLKQTGAYIIKLDTSKMQGELAKGVEDAITKTENAIINTTKEVIGITPLKKEVK